MDGSPLQGSKWGVGWNLKSKSNLEYNNEKEPSAHITLQLSVSAKLHNFCTAAIPQTRVRIWAHPATHINA
jgi:hypothetical protein